MRIGFVHNYGLYGSGSGTYTRGVSAALRALGHELVVISRASSHEGATFSTHADAVSRPPSVDSHGITHYALASHPYIGIETHLEGHPDGDFRTCSQHLLDDYLAIYRELLTAIARREQLDLLHVNHAVPLPFVASLTKADLDLPYVVTLHGSHITYVLDADSQRYAPLAQAGLSSASRVIFTADAVRRRCLVHVHLADHIFKYVPVGVDRTAVARTRPRKSIPGMIAFVGKVIADKGAHLMPFILAQARMEHPDARLVMVGDGPLVPVLRRFVSGQISVQSFLDAVGVYTEPVQDFLSSESGAHAWAIKSADARMGTEVLGYQDGAELRELLSRARVCVMPSLTEEALPITAVEAASRGALPVAEEVSGFTEFVCAMKQRVPRARDVLDPLRVEPDTTLIERYGRAAARGLKIEGEAGAADELSDALVRLVDESFTWDVIALELSHVYEEALR